MVVPEYRCVSWRLFHPTSNASTDLLRSERASADGAVERFLKLFMPGAFQVLVMNQGRLVELKLVSPAIERLGV